MVCGAAERDSNTQSFPVNQHTLRSCSDHTSVSRKKQTKKKQLEPESNFMGIEWSGIKSMLIPPTPCLSRPRVTFLPPVSTLPSTAGFQIRENLDVVKHSYFAFFFFSFFFFKKNLVSGFASGRKNLLQLTLSKSLCLGQWADTRIESQGRVAGSSRRVKSQGRVIGSSP